MNTFYTLLKSMIIFICSIIILPLFLTILNLINIENNRIFIIILSALLMFIIGIITGINSNKKAYLKGLLISVICTTLFILISLLLRYTININSIIYYTILILSTITGSMIGINYCSKKNS